MPPTCKPEECLLASDVEDIKDSVATIENTQTKILTEQAKFHQKIDDYLDRGTSEHSRYDKHIEKLYERTEGSINFSHLKNTIYIVVAIVAVVSGVYTVWG